MKKLVSFEYANDWYAFFHLKQMNWIAFRFVVCELVWDEMTRYLEWRCILLGLGILLRINCGFERSKAKKIIDETREEK